MARETKAEREARELAEQQAELRHQRAAERKAAKEAAATKEGPQVLIIEFSDDVKAFLTKLFSSAPTVARQSYTQPEKEPIAATNKTVAAEAPKEATVTLTQIREAINAKAGENKTAAIVKLLGSFGAKNASSLAEESFGDFYEQLINL